MEGQGKPNTVTPTAFFSPWFPNHVSFPSPLPSSGASPAQPRPQVEGLPQDFSPHLSQEQHDPLLSISMPRGLSLIVKQCLSLPVGPPDLPQTCPLLPRLCHAPHPHPDKGAALLCSHVTHGHSPRHPLNYTSLAQSFEKTSPHPQARGTLPSQSSSVSEKPVAW